MDYSKQKVTELRDECRNRGLETSGLKAELVARLEEDDLNNGGGGAPAAAAAIAPVAATATTGGRGGRKKATAAAEEVAEEVAPPTSTNKRTISQAIAELKEEGNKKKKTFLRKVDVNCGVSGAEVLEDYDCMLNQTNIGQNNNKFYVVQVIKTPGGQFYCYNRWGNDYSFFFSLSLFVFCAIFFFFFPFPFLVSRSLIIFCDL